MRTRAPEERGGDPGAVVAPGEIRELIARLTQQAVEAVPPHEARTLEALALETGIPLARLRETLDEMRRQGRFAVPPAAWFGFAFLALFAYWVVAHPPPGQAPAPVVAAPLPVAPKVEPDLRDTVPLTSVTYGPDGGTTLVDPTFTPPTALPEGLSLSATVGEVLWGTGDHRAKAITKLEPAHEAALRSDTEALLRYVRAEAARRRLAPAPGGGAFFVMLSVNAYGGSAGASVKLPLPGAADDAKAEAAIRRAVDEIVDAIRSQFRQQERWRREQGP